MYIFVLFTNSEELGIRKRGIIRVGYLYNLSNLPVPIHGSQTKKGIRFVYSLLTIDWGILSGGSGTEIFRK